MADVSLDTIGGEFKAHRELFQDAADRGAKTGRPYFKFVCSNCDAETSNHYSDPYYTRLLERRLCFNCNYYVDLAEELEKTHTHKTIIEGCLYTPGNRTEGSFRGMAGRRFDIEYIEPSIYAGQRITTFDLWAGGTLPKEMRERFPDTAKFLGGASKAQVGDIGCWNASDTRNRPFPLPYTLKPNK